VSVKLKDFSLVGRILAYFPEKLTPVQRFNDELTELGELATRPEANIMKLPNISASIPQLKAAIKELQGKGYGVPDYPDNATTQAEKDIKARYGKVFGSVVNPVLREGNSDRRAAGAVKQYARNNPHKMGAWSSNSKSHVAYMSSGDYYGSEISTTVAAATNARIELVGAGGAVTVLKAKTPIDSGEIIDAAVMGRKALRAFFAEQIDEAKKEGVLFSLQVKATMMKIADPIIFGHAVSVYFADVIAKHVAGDGDCVLTLSDALERKLDRFDRRQNADVEPRGVLILQVLLDFGDHLGVVRALGVEPEHRRGAGEARAAHTELDPVLDRRVPELAHAEDVAGLDRTLQQHLAVIGNDADRSVRGNFERLVV